MSQRYTMADYQALNEAIASGAKTVNYNGQAVTYRSLTEMFAIRDQMERDLGLSTGKKRRTRAVFGSGL